jgi:steroid delta-isomerase-like uncharacterized protein
MGRRFWPALVVLAVAVPAGFAAGRERQSEMLPEEVAKAYVEAYNAHDAAKLMELYEDNVVVTVPDLTEVKGKPENLKYYEAWFQSVPDVKNVLKTLTIEDDRFVLELTETGTYRKRMPSPGYPAARSQKLNYPYVLIGRVRNGKIFALRIYENDLVVEKQLQMR